LIIGLITLFKNISAISLKVLIISSVPLLLDVCFTFLGIYDYSQTIALMTGLAVGGIIYLILLTELEKFYNQFNKNE
jgi:hypothetical protein